MQRLVRRTAQAERQVSRRGTRRSDKIKNAEQRLEFNKRMNAVRATNTALKLARKRRREDWEMGALAPIRDTPNAGETRAYWGSLSTDRSLSRLPQKQIELACRWAGGSKYLCLKPGDRLAIMEGPDKGRIGILSTVEMELGAVTLEGDDLEQNYTVSDFITKAKFTPGDLFVQPNSIKVPIQAVRLVHPIQDPKTRQFRDVIIKELVPDNVYRDKRTGRVTWDRVVSGLKIKIPWSQAAEKSEEEEWRTVVKDNPCDTPRPAVENKTYIPTLIRPPIPRSVIDELRNRYSKFRTRHNPTYLKKMEAKDKMSDTRKLVGKALLSTPLQEINAKYRQMRKQRGDPVLTSSMLAKIGEIMVKNSHIAPAVNKRSAEAIRRMQSPVEVAYTPNLSRTTNASTKPGAVPHR